MKPARRFLRLLGHIHAAPNTALGLLGGLGGRFSWDREHGVVEVRGGWLARVNNALGFGGIALGDVVLSWRPMPDVVRRHERAHVVQARLFGPLYLPLTLLGYLVGFLMEPRQAHDASPLEIWADAAAGCLSWNRSRLARHLREWTGFKGPGECP